MLCFLRTCAGFCRRFFFLFPREIECRFSFQSLDARSARAARFRFERSRDERPGVQRDDGSPRERRGAAITRSQLLDHYEQIARASQSMLDAARESDWEEVERQEERCRALVASLKAASIAAPLLRPQDNRRRMELLRRMLAADAEIRGRSEPWLRQLEQLISSPRQHR
jgi:flagellar protein FliT